MIVRGNPQVKIERNLVTHVPSKRKLLNRYRARVEVVKVVGALVRTLAVSESVLITSVPGDVVAVLLVKLELEPSGSRIV